MAFDKMREKRRMKKQINSILKETDNPAIIQDVVDTEFGVIPGTFDIINDVHNRPNNLAQDATDGKTYNVVDEDK
ncbi:hypothetical protein [Salirhabdus salicampi]|uniref:hypothetical protein n=1 Tax=Salirhabdus salicampi TaxID=476102 RepID=UPI0020C538E5|nr:hypothetical protein [Salirhabdus salicampi]MCP8617283.1 hypothetical protein [Salirhabdus salicampi]